MNTIIKMFIIIIMASSILVIMPANISKAASLSDIVSKMGKSKAPPNNTGTKRLKNIVKRVLGAIRLLTGLASIIMIAYTGFKIVVGNTPDEKNSIKKAMIPIITGTLITFSATSIAVFIIGIFE